MIQYFSVFRFLEIQDIFWLIFIREFTIWPIASNWRKVKISATDLIKDEDYKDPFDIEKEKSNLCQEKVENIKKFKDVDEEYEDLGSTLKDDWLYI